ncbi:MAG: hotdog fold thioesterase [Bacteroidia bacterium]
MNNKLEIHPLDKVNEIAKNTIVELLGIKITAIGDDYVEATMPVDKRTHQTHGLLHGGASVVLAETIGSVGAALSIDRTKFRCVGIEINANHVKGVRSGLVTGRATPVHIGRNTHVWNIEIRNESGEMVCISRLTVAIVPL